MKKAETRIRFVATIHKIGINPYVDVPIRVSKALGKTGYVPVRVTVNDHAFRAGFVSLGGSRHRLYINGAMRNAAHVGVGDRITVTVAHDAGPRGQPVPAKLQDAFAKDQWAKGVWDALPPSKRNEILSYVNFLKRPETVDRIIAKILTVELPRLADKRGLSPRERRKDG